MDDRARVEALLGRPPRGDFDVVVRDADGDPVVVRNAALLDDATPMPTRYYLVGAELVKAVSRIEAAGGVRGAEAAIAPDAIRATHDAYARERDAALAADHEGPRPHGGVGGTRQGVKCLHAHLANLLAGADDPVGRWTLAALAADGVSLAGLDPPPPGPTPPEPTPPEPTPLEPEQSEPAQSEPTPAEPTPAEPTQARDPGRDGGRDADVANADAGGLTIHIADDRVDIAMTGGGTWTLPLGPVTLLATELAEHDPPRPAQLTNALGIVHDYFDDVVRAAPTVLATPSVVVTGRHVEAVAHLEIGDAVVPIDYRLERSAADEVFRTVVAEPAAERRFNPGLTAAHVETVVATLCIVLAIMRRLALDSISIGGTAWH